MFEREKMLEREEERMKEEREEMIKDEIGVEKEEKEKKISFLPLNVQRLKRLETF